MLEICLLICYNQVCCLHCSADHVCVCIHKGRNPLGELVGNYNLRHRTHSLELPAHTTLLTDCAFITHMLYKDVY